MVLESNEVLRIQEHSKVQRTIKGSRIPATFGDLRRRNLHVHGTTCQREMHEYGDQNVTKVLVHWKISFNEGVISQQHLLGKVFSRGGKC